MRNLTGAATKGGDLEAEREREREKKQQLKQTNELRLNQIELRNWRRLINASLVSPAAFSWSAFSVAAVAAAAAALPKERQQLGEPNSFEFPLSGHCKVGRDKGNDRHVGWLKPSQVNGAVDQFGGHRWCGPAT